MANLNDSKQLTESSRDHFFSILTRIDGVQFGVGISTVAEIDRFNILQATYLAMRRAVEALPVPPDHILVDGRPVLGLPVMSTAIVKGDSLSFSIAAASVIAKVTRDHMMRALAVRYPRYGFEKHKGYGTAQHIQALLEFGPVDAHRQTFRPVRDALGIRRRLRGECPDEGIQLEIVPVQEAPR